MTLEVILSKSGTQNPKLGHPADRGIGEDIASGEAWCATALWPWKRGHSRVSVAPLWSRSPRFDARLCTVPWFPHFAYKYPGVFPELGRGVFE